MSAAENKALVCRYLEELRQGRQAVDERFFSPSCAFYLPEPVLGLEVFEQINNHYRIAFPDLRIDINDLIADADKVTAYLTLHGTHRATFMGIPPTNKSVKFDSISIYRIKANRIVEYWEEQDLYGLQQQLRKTSKSD